MIASPPPSPPRPTPARESDTAPSLSDLARRIEKLAPDRRDPERHHCEKSEIVHALTNVILLPKRGWS